MSRSNEEEDDLPELLVEFLALVTEEGMRRGMRRVARGLNRPEDRDDIRDRAAGPVPEQPRAPSLHRAPDPPPLGRLPAPLVEHRGRRRKTRDEAQPGREATPAEEPAPEAPAAEDHPA